MKIRKINLHFFKNHEHLEMTCDAKLVGISGLNGKGKTNVLDAIYFLCSGKSYFSGTDVQCIMDGEESAGIIAMAEDEGDLELKLILQRGKRKRIERNGKAYKRVLDYVGSYHAVVIAPGDIELIYGTNSLRRNFVNQVLGQTDRNYLEDLVKYNRLLEQRNVHLKSERTDALLLETLDVQLAPLARHIYEKREALFGFLVPLIQKYYEEISNRRESVGIHYNSRLSREDYLLITKELRNRDRLLRRSNGGIHKDEVEFEIEGKVLKKYGSQGQIKSFLIALKLAEYEYYRERTDSLPVILLDDIFEKIDPNRAKALTGIIKKATFGQIFISDTEKDRLEKFCKAVDENYILFGL